MYTQNSQKSNLWCHSRCFRSRQPWACVHTCIYIWVRSHVHPHICVCVCVCVWTCVHVYVYLHFFYSMLMGMGWFSCICILMYIYIYICVCVCVYVHAHLRRYWILRLCALNQRYQLRSHPGGLYHTSGNSLRHRPEHRSNT